MKRNRPRRRNPNRGVVLALHDAAAILRWLEFSLDDRRFFNPLIAFEAKQAAEAAKVRLEAKLIAIFTAHGPPPSRSFAVDPVGGSDIEPTPREREEALSDRALPDRKEP